jgi:hypothetical protein
MFLSAWRLLALVLAALALTMTSAHVLELPAKMRYDAELYATVNATLYRNFATVGAVYTLGAIVAALVLVFLVRGRGPVFWWTLGGAVCLLLAFGSWLVLVQPVNQEVAKIMRSLPSAAPAAWTRLRPRWEYGHAVGFVLQLCGFCALVVAVLFETSGSRSRSGALRVAR